MAKRSMFVGMDVHKGSIDVSRKGGAVYPVDRRQPYQRAASAAAAHHRAGPPRQQAVVGRLFT